MRVTVDTEAGNPQIEADRGHPRDQLSVFLPARATTAPSLRKIGSRGLGYGAPVTLLLKEPQGSRTFEYPVPSSLTVTTNPHSPGLSDHPSTVEVAQGV
jgi:hypothetical protein